MKLRALAATLALLGPASCASAPHESGGPLPFKVAVIPFDVDVLPGANAKDESGDSLEPRFDSANFTQSIRDALAGQFAEVAVLPWPPEVTAEEFRRRPRGAQDQYWMRACAEASADLVLDCDVKVPRRVRYSHNDKFWLNLPLFLLGGPLCYFVNDTTYRGEARLVGVLHQVLPIRAGRATLTNGYAEVARFEVKFDSVSLDFLDRVELASFLPSLVIPPGLLAMSNSRVCGRFASETSAGLAAGLAREIDESSASILKTDGLADFYLTRDVTAIAAGPDVRVEGDVVVRTESAAEMREYVILYGSHRVTGPLQVARVDALLSTDREQFLRLPFAETVPREDGIDLVRIELVQGGREQIERTFTVPVSRVAARAAE